MKKQKGYIGVDFDGTLAKYEKYEGPTVLGEPIPKMVERVKRWLSEGKNVVIFTARVATDHPLTEQWAAEAAIKEWCKTHIGQSLQVTATKYSAMYEFWDDKAIGVEKNTGERK
jgi:hypothetical protein